MVDDHAKALVKELLDAGLSEQAVKAAWPTWWSGAAASSPSARAELRFVLRGISGCRRHHCSGSGASLSGVTKLGSKPSPRTTRYRGVPWHPLALQSGGCC